MHSHGPDVAAGPAPAREPGSARWWAERAVREQRRRPRAGGLSTARITAAALDVLRADGVDGLTVRAVAERLHTRSASLYRHIASRDELLALLTDHVMGDIRIVRTGRGWRADVEALMHEMRRVLLSQPLPPSTGRNTAGYGPNTLRLIDAVLALFLEAGQPPDQAAYATTTLIQFVAGTADIQRSVGGRGPHGAARAAGFADLLRGLPAERYPALRAAGSDYLAVPADDVFGYGVAVLLDGVATRLPKAD